MSTSPPYRTKLGRNVFCFLGVGFDFFDEGNGKDEFNQYNGQFHRIFPKARFI